MSSPLDHLRSLRSDLLTPARRDLLILVIGLALLLSPVFVSFDLVGGSSYDYESAEVVPTEDGIELVDGATLPPGTPLSEDIACSGTLVDRACATERALVDNQSVTFGYSATELDEEYELADPPTPFVLLDGTIYRTGDQLNESVELDDGSHPLEATLTPSIPEAALSAVSVDEEEVSSTIVTAAREGETTSRTSADVPETLVALEDGTYHRVYLADHKPAGTGSQYVVLLFFSTGLGLVMLLNLTRRIRITYVGDQE